MKSEGVNSTRCEYASFGREEAGRTLVFRSKDDYIQRVEFTSPASGEALGFSPEERAIERNLLFWHTRRNVQGTHILILQCLR